MRSDDGESCESSVCEARNALKELEAFSLNTSEEINDGIEQLVDCISNNSIGLTKAMSDLASMRETYSDENMVKSIVMTKTAANLLYQFQEFSSYTM